MGSKSRQQKVRLAAFVPIFHDELESTAYRTLTPSAAKLLPYFKRVCVRATRGAPDYTTIFGFTYTEAEKYGFISRTYIRAVKDLVSHGFIDLVEQGGLREPVTHVSSISSARGGSLMAVWIGRFKHTKGGRIEANKWLIQTSSTGSEN